VDINELKVAIEHYEIISKLLDKTKSGEERLHETRTNRLKQTMDSKANEWFYYTKQYPSNEVWCEGTETYLSIIKAIAERMIQNYNSALLEI